LEWTVLVLSQSRAGYLAAIVSTVIALLFFGKRGYQALGSAIILAGIVILVAGPREVIDSFLYAGKQSGLSVEHLFTGRPVIWERAVFALRDFAFTGVGLGAFGVVVPLLYPMGSESSPPVLGDAHNFFLQAATDGGVAGFIIVVWIIVIVVRRLYRSLRIVPRMSVNHSIIVGLVATFVAFLIYNLVDCVALGTKAGIAFWMYLALVEVVTGRMLPERVGEGGRRRGFRS
ncbi:MAG: O-antigen ligase family protein, partial [Chlorobi bacterium]|nr:O-antigen ligase family protein [Chlorobiota bacterium]